MDWSQALYLLILGAALYTGRPGVVVGAAMGGNLAGTMAFSGDPMAVAVVDMASVALLIGRGWRANIAAALFVAMQPVYIIGHHLGLQNWAIYALIDVMAYCQCAIIGGWDGGVGRLGRFIHRRLNRRVYPLALRGAARQNMGACTPMVSGNSRGLNGPR